jgi:uncharacterized repeat protein (TIGR01451 family)
MALSKTADKATFDSAGQVVNYTLTAVNEGNVTLHGVAIADTMLGALDCTPAQPADLAPGGTLTCTGSHIVTQAEINAGKVDNTASASGAGPQDQPASAAASLSVPATQAPHLSLTKVASPTSYDAVGQVVAYTLVATNDGNVSLTEVAISDSMLEALDCTPAQPAALEPGDSLTCTGSRTVTQADLDAGSIANTAEASGKDPAGATVSALSATATVSAAQSPHVTITKSAGRTNYDAAGQVVEYTLVLTNDGNVTLHDAQIEDALLSALTCAPAQPATLPPGGELTCTGSHTVTQADLNAGQVNNSATASAAGPQDQPASATASKSIPATQSPHLSLAKSANATSYDVVGQVVQYTLVATNDGNVTLTGVEIADPLFAALECAPSQPAELAPGETLTCASAHTIMQADLDAGAITNTATASGTDPANATVESLPATVTVTAGQQPHLSLAKSASLVTYDQVGQLIEYTLAATNDGNVTLHDVAIGDPMFASLDCTPAQMAELAPGATLTCAGGYTVTQADLNVGKVDNTATVTGIGPAGPRSRRTWR